MIVFLDASAIMTDEPGAFKLERRFGAGRERLCSAMSLWETVRAIARKRAVPAAVVHSDVEAFRTDFALRPVAIGMDEAAEAIRAHERYGRDSGHPARLNMGDCFGYACARTNKARLLYEGEDFAHTDLAWQEPA